MCREEHRLRDFEIRVFGSKRERERESNRRMKKIKNEELHDLLSSQAIICVVKFRRLGWAGHVAGME